MGLMVGSHRHISLVSILGGAFFYGPTAAQAEEPPRAVVLPLKSDSFETKTLEALDEILAVEVSSHTNFQLITKGDINAQLEHESLKDALGCDETGCAAELAGALNARYLLTGTLRKFAYSVTVTLNLIDTHEEKIRRAQGKSEDNIVFYEDAVKEAVRTLFDVKSKQSETEQPTPSAQEAAEAQQPPPKTSAKPGQGESLKDLTLRMRSQNIAMLEDMESGQNKKGLGEDDSAFGSSDPDFFHEKESVTLETFKWLFTLGAATGAALLVIGAAELPPVEQNPNAQGGFIGSGAALVGTGALLWVLDLTDVFE